MRKASVNFQQVTSIGFAISHSERTELHEPGYLLPKQFRHQNAKIDGSWSEDDLKAAFQYRRDKLSRQAKIKGASPFWEGVINLPDISGFEINDYLDQQSVKLKKWKELYEEKTGMHVLHMVIHLDEGYLDEDGQPVYNPHAHVLVDRVNEADNKIIRLGRQALSEIQNLTAEVMEMERGETLKQREGFKGRKHLNAQEYRDQANAQRAKLLQASKVVEEALSIVSQLEDSSEQEKDQLHALQEQLSKEQAKVRDLEKFKTAFFEVSRKYEKRLYGELSYSELRAWLKGTGRAIQADYSALKKLNEDPSTQHHIRKLAGLINEEGGDPLKALREIAGIASPQPARQPDDEKARRQAQKIASYHELRGWLMRDGEATPDDYTELETLSRIPAGRQIAALAEVMETGGNVLEALHEFVPPQPSNGSGYRYNGP